LEDAYTAVARIELLNQGRRRGRVYLLELEYLGLAYPWRGSRRIHLQPEYWLEITSASFASPGFWEVVGSLNPLQQLREYLKDRHERRKDREWRESTEKEKAQLENELLRAQLDKERLSILGEYAETMRSLGATDDQIREQLWNEAGKSFSKLAHHQDTGLLTDQRDDEE
jgi:hypothetical protein